MSDNPQILPPGAAEVVAAAALSSNDINDDDVESTYIICGRGPKKYNHKGNIKFRELIEKNVQLYRESSKHKKGEIINRLIEEIKIERMKFMECNKEGIWKELTLKESRQKISHRFRDVLREVQKAEEGGGIHPNLNNNSNKKNKNNMESHVLDAVEMLLSMSNNNRTSTSTSSSSKRTLSASGNKTFSAITAINNSQKINDTFQKQTEANNYIPHTNNSVVKDTLFLDNNKNDNNKNFEGRRKLNSLPMSKHQGKNKIILSGSPSSTLPINKQVPTVFVGNNNHRHHHTSVGRGSFLSNQRNYPLPTTTTMTTATMNAPAKVILKSNNNLVGTMFGKKRKFHSLPTTTTTSAMMLSSSHHLNSSSRGIVMNNNSNINNKIISIQPTNINNNKADTITQSSYFGTFYPNSNNGNKHRKLNA